MDTGKLLAGVAFVLVVVVGLALKPGPRPPADEFAPPDTKAAVSAPAPPPAPAEPAPLTGGPVGAPNPVGPASAPADPGAAGGTMRAQPIDPKAVQTRVAPLSGPAALAELKKRQDAESEEFRKRHAKHGPLIENAKPGITSEEVKKRDAEFEAVKKKERAFDTLSPAEQEAFRAKFRALESDIAANPADASLYAKLAAVQREARLEMMAAEALDRGLAKNPNDVTLLAARAKLWADFGFADKAAESYEALLKQKPDDAEAKKGLEQVRKLYTPGLYK